MKPTLRERIYNHMEKKHFAGRKVVCPKAGDIIRVLQGEFVGEVFTVVTVQGNVYAIDQQVYVNCSDHPSGLPIWYFPWDVEIVR